MRRIDEVRGCDLENSMLHEEPNEPFPGFLECFECGELTDESYATEIDYRWYCDICSSEILEEDQEDEDDE